jgi:hypothetical protein
MFPAAWHKEETRVLDVFQADDVGHDLNDREEAVVVWRAHDIAPPGLKHSALE